MGGKTSQLGGDFANIALQAIKGINGDASKLSQYIQPNSRICNPLWNYRTSVVGVHTAPLHA